MAMSLRIRHDLVKLGLVVAVALVIRPSDAYIASPNAVPVGRHVQWLKKMTVDFCQAEPGQLSKVQLSQAPELIYAWSHVHIPKQSLATKKECALAVESLVKRVIDERRAGSEQADLTVNDYNCLIEGWARSGQGVAAAERCEQILEAMQQHGPHPDLTSFKTTLMAWRLAGAAVQYAPLRAQRILEWMIRLYQDGANRRALPDADCFDVVLQIWSRSGHEQAPMRTEQILGLMERLYESEGLEKLKPRNTSFNAVLASWSKSGRPEAADRAMAILSFMELLAANGDKTIVPDSASYNTVMSAFARSQDQGAGAYKTDAILRHAEEAYQNDPSYFALDSILYNTAIAAWSKASKSGSYRKARSILDRQLDVFKSGCDSCKPDIFGYTSVIASCASEHGDQAERAKAYDVAVKTYEELRDNNDMPAPNHVTYGTMLKACAKLLPPGPARIRAARKIFEECLEAGCVGDMAVSRLHEAAPLGMVKKLLQGHSRRALPAEWTRNVDGTSDHHRRRKSVPKRQRAEV
jgi:hypothetical protein